MSCKKSFIFSARLARYVQEIILQDLTILAIKMLVKFDYFLQGSFYWVATYHYEQNEAIFINIKLYNADTWYTHSRA